MTKDGIEYNLEITPYFVEKEYNGSILKYKFSSDLYKNKFLILSKYTPDNKFMKKGVEIDRTLENDLLLYSAIEKRGFLIESSFLSKITKLSDIKIKITYEVM